MIAVQVIFGGNRDVDAQVTLNGEPLFYVQRSSEKQWTFESTDVRTHIRMHVPWCCLSIESVYCKQ